MKLPTLGYNERVRVCDDCCHVKRSARRLAHSIRHLRLEPTAGGGYLEWVRNNSPPKDSLAVASPDSDYTSPQAVHAESCTPEQRIIQIWKRVLRLDDVDTDADFFRMGGKYPLAVRVVKELSRVFDCPVALEDLYSNPTVGKLAVLLGMQAPVVGASSPSRNSGLAAVLDGLPTQSLGEMQIAQSPVQQQLSLLENQLESLLDGEATAESISQIEEIERQLDHLGEQPRASGEMVLVETC